VGKPADAVAAAVEQSPAETLPLVMCSRKTQTAETSTVGGLNNCDEQRKGTLIQVA
jgi:hypothetical protein